VLESLDRSGLTADRTTLAREAHDDLANATDGAAARVRAYADLLTGQTETAATELAARAAATPNDHAVRVLLARAQAELGQFDAAHTTLESLVAEDPRNVDAWFGLGKYSIMAGDSKRAVDEYLQRANVLARRLNDRRALVDVVNAMGIGYQNLGQLDDSIEQFESAIKLRETIGDKRGEAVSLRNLSFVQAIKGNFAEAQNALDRAKAILDPLGDTAATAGLINDIGALDEERGDYRHALESYRTALTMHQSLGDPRLIARSLVNVGFAYYQVGEFDNAEVYWTQAVSAYEKFDDVSGSVSARLSLALAQIAKGDFQPARQLLENGLNQAEKLQMAEARAIGAANLAELDRLEGRIASALERSGSALEQFRQRDDPRGIVEMKLLRAAIFRDTGDWDSADAALADLTADNVENHEQAAMLMSRRGEIALGRGDAQAALALANDAVAAAQNAHSFGNELSARLLKAKALQAQKKTRDASAELVATRNGLAKYASIPLRLQLAEASLQISGDGALADYRAARAELARLPSYVRAFEIHALAATLPHKSAGEIADATRAAATALDDLVKHTPAAQQPTLEKLAAAYGVAAAQTRHD
jgi:tetratricopeptide (TPR) repeat protein